MIEDAAAQAARYAENAARLVPGYAQLQRLAGLALAEGAGPDARILVVGAGGGQELVALADAHPGWRFDGVDPKDDMLEMARAVLGPRAARVSLHAGTVDAAPEGPFDGATVLLVLHFLTAAARRQLLEGVFRRLRPEARLVVAHHSFPAEQPARDRWLARYAAQAVDQGVAPDQAEAAAKAIGARLPILSPEDDARMLDEAGFADVDLIWAGFTLRAWVARRP